MENDREMIIREIRDMWTEGLEAKKGSERYFQASYEIERITLNVDLKSLEYFLSLARLFYKEEILGLKDRPCDYTGKCEYQKGDKNGK